MNTLTMANPVFVAYSIAAAIMILKIMGQGWMTVYGMMKTDAGLRNGLLEGGNAVTCRDDDPPQTRQASETCQVFDRLHHDVQVVVQRNRAGVDHDRRIAPAELRA